MPGKSSDVTSGVEPAQRAVAAVQARYPGLIVAESGDASISDAVGKALGSDFRKAEETSVPITLILLLVVFGSLIAAGIPLLLALTAVIAAISLLSVVGQWLPVGSSTSEVVLIIGMAVGIDYSLFYLRREREERARGRSFAEALRIAAGTSGKAIVISGLTVMVALAGLFLTGLSVFDGVAFGSIAVVGIAVAGSLTVLPALLSWLGPRADRGRIPVPAAAGWRPSFPAVGGPGPARGAASRLPGAAWRRWRCSPLPRPRSACGSATRRSTRRRAWPWSRRWTASSGPSRRGRPRPRSWSPVRTWAVRRWPGRSRRCRGAPRLPGRFARRSPWRRWQAAAALVVSVPLAGNGSGSASPIPRS